MELKEALSKLDEQESIVDFFRDQQIQGVPGVAVACPVSNYLYEVTGKRYIVSEAYIIDAGETDEMVMGEELSKSVREFIWGFDQDVYPDLCRNATLSEAVALGLTADKALQMAACLRVDDGSV